MLEPEKPQEGAEEVPAEENGKAPAQARLKRRKKKRRKNPHAGNYFGGSKPGHAPTHNGSNLFPPGQGTNTLLPASDPNSPAHDTRFQPGHKFGYAAKSKERQCMEAIQNGRQKKELEARFPPGMVARLVKLQKTAEDPDSPHYMHANRIIREILSTLATTKAEREAEEAAFKAAQGPRAIQLFHGRLDVPMPGAAKGE